MSSFDTFDWSDPSWQSVEKNLYFSSSSQAENERILLKRKRKWFKANIDPDFEWDENETSAKKHQESAKSETPKSSHTASSSANTSSSNTSSSYSPRSGSSNANSASLLARYGMYISWIQLALHTGIILNVLTYLLPLLGVEEQNPSFFRVMVLTLIAQAIYLLRQHGRPRWNGEYGRSIFQDEQAHFFFLAIVLLNATPMILLLLPFLTRSLVFVCGGLKQILPRAAPSVYAVVAKPIEKVVSLYSQIYANNASLEAIAGFILIFNLFTPSRNFMLLIGYWQYLRIRYMLSSDSKRAFGSIRVKVEGWVNHPMCPQLVRTVFTKVVTLMEQYTDQEALARQAEQPGIMNKCTIM